MTAIHWKSGSATPNCGTEREEVGSKLGLLMQDMLLDAFPKTFHMDGGRRGFFGKNLEGEEALGSEW